MLMPKRAKYRKVQRGRMTGVASRGNKVSYGEFGIQALEPGWITGNQIEAARIAMTRYTKRGGKVWIKIFPDKPYSKKGLGTRMGSGKGAPEGWVAVVKNQKVMFEIGGVPGEQRPGGVHTREEQVEVGAGRADDLAVEHGVDVVRAALEGGDRAAAVLECL